jgi:hypothetical protein
MSKRKIMIDWMKELEQTMKILKHGGQSVGLQRGWAENFDKSKLSQLSDDLAVYGNVCPKFLTAEAPKLYGDVDYKRLRWSITNTIERSILTE